MMMEVILLLASVLMGSLALGLPAVLSVMLATIAYAIVYSNMSSLVLIQALVNGLDKPVFTAIPYFFLLGTIMNAGGISNRLLRLATALIGWSRGGLAHVNICTSILIGGMSGSAAADASAIGSVMIPAMKKSGYPAAYAAAVTASSATIGLLIPPSIPLVLFGIFNNVSIGDLFIAGVVPGLLMGLYLLVASFLIARKRQYPAHPWRGFSEVLEALNGSLLALLLPLVIVFCLANGIATASEVGAVACACAAFISILLHRDTSFSELCKSTVKSAVESASVLSIIAVSGGLLWILASVGTADEIETLISALELSPMMMLALIAFGILVLGTMVGPGILMILVVPTLTPLAVSNGINVVQFGIVTVLASAIGLITPPVGFLLYLTSAQADSQVLSVVRESAPFLLALIALLVSLIVFPALSIGLLEWLQ